MTSEEAKNKLCPLTFIEHKADFCAGDGCMWWLRDGTCAIADIADSLGDLGYIADALDGINKRYGYSAE